MDELDAILADLAAGRISQAEAARRIDAASTRPSPADGAATNDGAATSDGAATHDGPGHDEQTPGDPGDRGARSGQETDGGDEAQPSWGSIARGLAGAAGLLASSAATGLQGAGGGLGRSAHDVVDGIGKRWEARGEAAHRPGPMAPSPERPVGAGGVELLVLRVTGRRVRLLGDHSVATVVVDGEHTTRRSGSTLELTAQADFAPGLDAAALLRAGRRLDLKGLGLDALGVAPELVVRVNPAIRVELEATGCSVTSTNLAWFGRVRVTAGSASLTEVVELSDALVQAGQVSVEGRFDRGRSRVRVESGNLVVGLRADADVEVHASSQLGRISWPQGSRVDSWTSGIGRGRLDVTVVVGAAAIRQQDEAGVHGHDARDDEKSEEGRR